MCATPTTCQICNTGYSLMGTTCGVCAAYLNCICSSTDTCSTCKSGFSKLPSTSLGCCAVGNTWSSTNGIGCVSCSSSLNCDRCNTAN